MVSGTAPSRPPRRARRPRRPVQRTIVAEGEQSVTLAWRTVPAGHPDEPALAVLAELVDNDVSGLLNVRLLLSGELPDAEGHGEQLVEAGYYALTGVARDDQSLAEVERLLHSIVSALKSGAFTQADIDAIVLHEQIREQMARESNGGRVSWIADAYLERRRWQEHVGFTQAMARVTPADILRVAATYLGPDHVAIHRKRGKPRPAEDAQAGHHPGPDRPVARQPLRRRAARLRRPDPEPAWLPRAATSPASPPPLAPPAR
jgi:predicted Zn-dependent peptidase